MNYKFLIKTNSFIIYLRKIIITNDLAFKLVKLALFSLSLLLLYKTIFPEIIYWAFVSPLKIGRIPMYLKHPTPTVTSILIVLWVFQIFLFCFKSSILYIMHKTLGSWKWKGFLFVWEQTTTMLFLTLAILGYSFLLGLSYGNLSYLFIKQDNLLLEVSMVMNSHETLVFYISNLSLIFFILFFIQNLSIKLCFKQLDEWRLKQK
jgi:hypothetical protein